MNFKLMLQDIEKEQNSPNKKSIIDRIERGIYGPKSPLCFPVQKLKEDLQGAGFKLIIDALNNGKYAIPPKEEKCDEIPSGIADSISPEKLPEEPKSEEFKA